MAIAASGPYDDVSLHQILRPLEPLPPFSKQRSFRDFLSVPEWPDLPEAQELQVKLDQVYALVSVGSVIVDSLPEPRVFEVYVRSMHRVQQKK